jgi:hypothetical protein
MHDRYTATQRFTLPPLTGMRRLVYWCGRILQILGLVLIWWVLLLFVGTASMWVLIYWSIMAIAVFFGGWVCIAWAKRRIVARHHELHTYMEQQEQVFLRLQPASETEERLARQIALCHAKLSQMQGWLSAAWGQMRKMREDNETPPVL